LADNKGIGITIRYPVKADFFNYPQHIPSFLLGAVAITMHLTILRIVEYSSNFRAVCTDQNTMLEFCHFDDPDAIGKEKSFF
jgi:hypothetical protein